MGKDLKKFKSKCNNSQWKTNQRRSTRCHQRNFIKSMENKVIADHDFTIDESNLPTLKEVSDIWSIPDDGYKRFTKRYRYYLDNCVVNEYGTCINELLYFFDYRGGPRCYFLSSQL